MSALVAVVFFYGLYQWFRGAWLMLTISRYYLPGINPWGLHMGINPFNAILAPAVLTPEGQERTRQCRIAFGKFIVCVLGGLLLGSFGELLFTNPE